MIAPLRTLAGVLGLLASAPAQAPSEAFRLFGALPSTDTLLVDDQGVVVHTWPSTFTPGLSAYLAADGALIRPIVTRNPRGLNGAGGGVQRLAFDGSVQWDFRYGDNDLIPHHDLALLPDGHLLLLVWERHTVAEAVAAGRDPALLANNDFWSERVVEIEPVGATGGTVVWQWRAWDHLVQDFDASRANFGVVGSHAELIDLNFPRAVPSSYDWIHANGIDYDPVHDQVLLSAHAQDEIWVIDHGTTTAEAAGHSGGRRGKGGDLLYRWGNPAAYRAGTAADQQLFGQHCAMFVPPGRPGAGHFTVFNNRGAATGSSVVELVPPRDAAGNFVLGASGRYGPGAPVWSYSAPGFDSALMSGAERLPNGNTLICSARQSLVFEVTSAGQTVWQYPMGGAFVFHAHATTRRLWSSAPTLSLATGGTIGFDLVAGSRHAGHVYLLLGSASGTSPGLTLDGQLLPLNADGYLLTALQSANRPPFGNTLGTLDGSGRGAATFSLPPNLPPALAGVRLDHAFVVFDAQLQRVATTSNAVALTLVP